MTAPGSIQNTAAELLNAEAKVAADPTSTTSSYVMAAASIAEEVIAKFTGIPSIVLNLATAIVSHELQARSKQPTSMPGAGQ